MTSLSNFYIALRENCMTFECDNNRITKFKYEACLTIYKNIYKVYSVFFLLKKKKKGLHFIILITLIMVDKYN